MARQFTVDYLPFNHTHAASIMPNIRDPAALERADGNWTQAMPGIQAPSAGRGRHLGHHGIAWGLVHCILPMPTGMMRRYSEGSNLGTAVHWHTKVQPGPPSPSSLKITAIWTALWNLYRDRKR